MKAPASVRVMRVFYRDYANGVALSSAQPESLRADRIRPLAERLLDGADNFIGVVDRNDVILQLYCDDSDPAPVLELVYPEAPGCLRVKWPRERAMALLDALPDTFDEDLLPGAQYLA